jgi:hypothetical protein
LVAPPHKMRRRFCQLKAAICLSLPLRIHQTPLKFPKQFFMERLVLDPIFAGRPTRVTPGNATRFPSSPPHGGRRLDAQSRHDNCFYK